MYGKGFFASFESDRIVISIGNLSVGGTGKTPFIEALLSLSSDPAQIAVISRGYGRSSKGLFRLQAPLDATLYGDEPCQIKLSYPAAEVLVSEDRAAAFEYVQQNLPHITHILLDDAFQNLRVKRSINVMLTAYHSPFFSDIVLPAGNLREFRWNASRADVIVITKCPVSIPNKDQFIKRIQAYNKNAKIVFTSMLYDEIAGKRIDALKFLALTSIANPDPMYKYLSDRNFVFEKMRLKDHATYTPLMVKKIVNFLHDSKVKAILSTSKDYVKLLPFLHDGLLQGTPVSVLPMHIQFLDSSDTLYFKELVA